MKRKKEKLFFNYECTITNEGFTTTEKAPNPKELTSVMAYYELHPEKDDRPLLVKKQVGNIKTTSETKEE